MNRADVQRIERAAQRGGIMARRLFAIVFRVFVFIVFAPIALTCFASRDTFGGWLAVACAFGLGALLAPMPDDDE